MNTTTALASFITSRKAKGLSTETLRWYEGILEIFAKRFPVLPESPDDIEDFIASCKSGDERRHGYFRAIRAFYRYLHKRTGVANPVELIESPKRQKKSPRALTVDELDQLLAFPHSSKIKTSLLFLADTGCRVGELHNVRRKDLLETPWGYVVRVRGKTGERLVPVSFEVYSALDKELPLPYSLYRLRRLISKAFRDAHVQGTAHTLRHTFGTLWQGDEMALQRIMGHSTLQTTKLYRHLRTQVLSEQHSRFTPLRMVYSRSKSML